MAKCLYQIGQEDACMDILERIESKSIPDSNNRLEQF
jgi:hypothetical protein